MVRIAITDCSPAARWSVSFLSCPATLPTDLDKKSKPEYIYTSLEMENRIGMHLFQFLHEVMHFRFSHLPDPRLSPRQP